MILRYNIERILEIIKKFKELTGIGIGVFDAEQRYLISTGEQNEYCALVQGSEEGRRRCNRCDRHLLGRSHELRSSVSHTCHGGLCDTAVPIYQDDMLLGYIMFGQIKSDNGRALTFDEVYPAISDICPDRDSAERAYGKLTMLDSGRLDAAAEIVGMLTKYVCLEHMIQPEYSEDFDALIKYLEDNITENNSISELCKKFHMSKNRMYGYFRSTFDCTVGEYLEGLRTREAKRLLRSTDLPVYEICSMVGIENYQYFCRRFKRATGYTPLGYRKSERDEVI